MRFILSPRSRFQALIVLIAIGTLAATASPQVGGPVATFRGGELSSDDLDAYIARVERHGEHGRQALHHLVKLRYITAESERRGLVISESEWRAFLERQDAQIRSRNLGSLDTYLRREGIPRARFEELARVDLMLEKLVRQDLGRRGTAPPTAGEKRLWLEDRLARVEVEAPDPKDREVAVRIAGQAVSLIELGRTIRADLERKVLEKHARDAVIERIVEQGARRAGVRLEPADIDREVALRKAMLSRHPRLGSLSWESYLEQQGHSAESFQRDPSIRTWVLLRKIVAEQFSRERWRAMYLEKRDTYDRLLGERRCWSWIFLRATRHPNPLERTSFQQAVARLAAARARLRAGQDFATLAARISEHRASREFGGKMSWSTRAATNLPPELLEILFTLDLEAVSEPLTLSDGVALVRVDAIEPPPDADEMVRRLQEVRARDKRKVLLADARIVLHLD